MDLGVKAGALFAAVFAVHQYLQAQEDARIARTLDYAARFEAGSSELGLARKRIDLRLWAYAGQVALLRGGSPGSTEQDMRTYQLVRQKLSIAVVYGTAESPGIQAEVHTVVQFFDGLGICVTSKLCDDKTAERLLGRYAAQLWDWVESFVDERRPVSDDYGQALERFARAGKER